jgi:V/A-type H+-transporting ATPase subunit I
MKKVTIITFPEYESHLLNSLGRASVTQLKPVVGAEFEGLRDASRDVDFKVLFNDLDEYYQGLSKVAKSSISGLTPSPEKMREIVADPKGKTEDAIEKLDGLIKKIEVSQDGGDIDPVERAVKEKLEREKAAYVEKRRLLIYEYNDRKQVIEALKVLGSEDISNSLCLGLIATDNIHRFERHLAKGKNVNIKPISISEDKSLIIVSGLAESKRWIESLFLVFEVTNIESVSKASISEIKIPLRRAQIISMQEKYLADWVTSIPGEGTFEDRLRLMEDVEEKRVAAEKPKIVDIPELDLLRKDIKNIGDVNFLLAKGEAVDVKAIPVSPEKNLIVVSGPVESKKWIDSLFLVFEVTDVAANLKTDIQTIGNLAKRETIIDDSEKSLIKLLNSMPGKGSFDDRLKVLDEEERQRTAIEMKAAVKKKPELDVNARVEILKSEVQNLGEINFLHKVLRFLSDDKVLVKRTRYYSILQGWTPDEKVETLKKTVKEIGKDLDTEIVLEIEDSALGDNSVPMVAPKMVPFLQPTWRLTTLRGWPVPTEINPAYISLLIFCIQFGFMFGDMGQGAIFLILGLYLSNKFKKGMFKKIGALFVPMGIAAIIFGALYGSIFLIEIAHPPAWLPVEEISHAVEGATEGGHELKFGFYTAILPNPVSKQGTLPLMEIIIKLAVAEILLGLILSSINQIKNKNYIGILGEHGIGMALFILSIYSAIGPGFVPSIGPVTLNLMMAGLVCSFIEPILHSLINGHGFGMQAIGEGIAGLLLTFVEGLSNLFSFLRVAAFALAHASLGVAAGALGATLPVPIAYLAMNVIAMTFELLSSSVQSMRLLYYEFMGKFYSGAGVPFTPFSTPELGDDFLVAPPEKVINRTDDV